MLRSQVHLQVAQALIQPKLAKELAYSRHVERDIYEVKIEDKLGNP